MLGVVHIVLDVQFFSSNESRVEFLVISYETRAIMALGMRSANCQPKRVHCVHLVEERYK